MRSALKKQQKTLCTCQQDQTWYSSETPSLNIIHLQWNSPEHLLPNEWPSSAASLNLWLRSSNLSAEWERGLRSETHSWKRFLPHGFNNKHFYPLNHQPPAVLEKINNNQSAFYLYALFKAPKEPYMGATLWIAGRIFNFFFLHWLRYFVDSSVITRLIMLVFVMSSSTRPRPLCPNVCCPQGWC